MALPEPIAKTSMFRPNDVAITDYSRVQLRSVTGKLMDIPIVFSTPERAFAKVTETYPSLTPSNLVPAPLPFMSVFRVNANFNQSRWRRGDLRGVTHTSDRKVTYNARFFRQYDMQYQIDIWSEMQDHSNRILEILAKRYDPGAMVPVDYGYWGKQERFVILDDISDNSNLEPGAEEDRLIRWTLTVTIEGRLYENPDEFQRVGAIHTSAIEFRETFADGSDILLEERVDDLTE